MRNLFIFILFMFLFVENAIAQNAILEPLTEGSVANVTTGEPFEGVLHIWPIKIDQIGSFEDQIIFDTFYVAAVTSVEVSKNNADLVDIKGMFIPVRVLESQTKWLTWQINNTPMRAQTEIRNINVTELGATANEYTYLKRPNKFDYSILYKAIAICFILIVLFLSIKRFLKIRSSKSYKMKAVLALWKKKFHVAKTREDFEDIYKNKDEWLELLDGVTPPVQLYFDVLNKCQYKPAWTDEEQIEVMHRFDDIRDIFKNKNGI